MRRKGWFRRLSPLVLVGGMLAGTLFMGNGLTAAAQETDETIIEKPVMNSKRVDDALEISGIHYASEYTDGGVSDLYCKDTTTLVMDTSLTLKSIDVEYGKDLTIQKQQGADSAILTLNSSDDFGGIDHSGGILKLDGCKIVVNNHGISAGTLRMNGAQVQVKNTGSNTTHFSALFFTSADIRNSKLTLEFSTQGSGYYVINNCGEFYAENTEFNLKGTGNTFGLIEKRNDAATIEFKNCTVDATLANVSDTGGAIGGKTVSISGGSFKTNGSIVGQEITFTSSTDVKVDGEIHASDGNVDDYGKLILKNATVTAGHIYAGIVDISDGKTTVTPGSLVGGNQLIINGDVKVITVQDEKDSGIVLMPAIRSDQITINGGNVDAQSASKSMPSIEAYNGTITIANTLSITTPTKGKVLNKTGTFDGKTYPYAYIVDQNDNIADHVIIGKSVDGNAGSGSSNNGGTGNGGNTGNTGTGWQQDSKGYWYRNADGTYPKNEWKQISGKWYHFDASGYMQTGWQKISGKWYYFGGAKDGAMKTGWQKIGGKWYYFNASGEMQTGWQKIGGKWYYLSTGGDMVTGWVQSGGKWYYTNASGVMQTGWVKVGNTWYYMNASGVMQTSWQKVGGKWYYLKSTGAMATGWTKVGSKWYYMNGSGVMMTGWQKIGSKWYYLNGGGDMVTGWKKLGGTWYYFENSGAMLANTSRRLGNKTYRFNAGGACTNP